MEQFDAVILTKDMPQDKLSKWQRGVILEVYDKNFYEVEFSDKNGITIFLGAIHKDCLDLIYSNKTNLFVGRFNELLELLSLIRKHIAAPSADITQTRYSDNNELLHDFDSLTEDFKHGVPGTIDKFRLWFAPTGTLQEISVNSGWAQEFIHLSKEFDELIDL